MNLLLTNLLHAVARAALTAPFNQLGLTTEFLVGFLALWLVQPLFERRSGGCFDLISKILKLLVHLTRIIHEKAAEVA
ncbi:hypothetical protein JSE7799_01998 [Jannaschia seosinensis]|uniref:Uncharacterized protein n=1 Tax=Jannaschia seosinensis TaxID=313367 RepID=A0A0M7BBT3_9RHOB|nr:hypothetical protein [Jannaschia seosinensis]CUH39274.1 hypothetical protein JSE7799_01998 [Jannaschia seosinensis]